MAKKFIDADAFLQRMIKKYHCIPAIDGGGFDFGYLDLDLDEQPAADVEEVRHGHWEFAGDNVVACSVCEEAYDAVMLPRNYCPNCGARMDGDNNA